MDSSLRTQFKNEPISDTQDEGSQDHPIHGERAAESAVRDNDDRIFTSSALTGTPFHLASFEDLSTQSTLLGSDKLHTDSPLFGKSEVFYEVTGEDRRIAQPKLDAKLHRGFFKVDDKWTTYRRNYFSVGVTVSFPSFPQEIQNGLYVQHGGEELRRIHAFSVKVSASVHGKDGESRRLIQHGPKRVRNSVGAPEEIFWFPHTISTTGEEAASRSEESNIPRNVELPENNAGDSRLFSHTFERILFERATLNNGKKESRQQYFNIVIELNAQISGGENSRGLHWLRVARITSEPIIVRGRSPGHYKDGRRDNHDSIRHGGDDMDLDNLMALPIICSFGTNLKYVNPVLDPDLYFGRLGDIEWKVAQICPLILHAMSLVTWPETIAILVQILNHARKGLELMKLERFAENGFSVLIEQPDDRGIVKAVSCGNEAAIAGSTEAVRLLLEVEAIEPDAPDSENWTPLAFAAAGGHIEIVRCLLQLPSRVNANVRDWDGATPLMWAARRGAAAAVELLLSCEDVDVTITDEEGRTALMWAVATGHRELVPLFDAYAGDRSGRVDEPGDGFCGQQENHCKSLVSIDH